MKIVSEYLSNISPSLKQKFREIEFIVFDFDGVFTDNQVYTDQNGIELVVSSKFDGFGLQKLKSMGIELFILSTEKNSVVKKRSEKLGVEFIQGLNSSEKLKEFIKLAEKKQIPHKSIAYMGNDINDIECLEKCGLPIVVKDSHPEILKFADYITVTKGGHGAVREVCDIIEALKA